MNEGLIAATTILLGSAIIAFSFKGFLVYVNEIEEKHSKRRKIEHEAEYAYDAISPGGAINRRVEILEGRVATLSERFETERKKRKDDERAC